MSSRLRNHIRGNVVGYFALFLVLTGGTAQALNGSNTVFSDDIVNRQVKTADIDPGAVSTGRLAPNAVKTGRVADDNLTGADISALTGADVTDESLNGEDVANGTLTGADVNIFQLGTGGDLSGSVGNAQIRGNAIGTDEVAANALGAADIDESSLDTIPSATNAQRVDGAGSRVISFHDPDPPGLSEPVTIGGLSLRIDCHGITPGTDNVEIEARTDTDNSWLQATAKGDTSQNPTTTVADISFNIGDVKEVQAAGDGSGQLVYRQGTTGGIVTANFAYNEGSSSCDAMAVALGSD